MTQTAINDKEAIKAAAKAKLEADTAEEKKLNEGRSGKGTRKTIGYTRGRSTQRIVYEAFDTDQPETLPTTQKEFMELSGISDEPLIVAFLIDGHNSYQYGNASDPVSEFVNPAWNSEMQSRFKVAVKNYATATEVELSTAVDLIKPGFEAAHAKALAAK